MMFIVRDESGGNLHCMIRLEKYAKSKNQLRKIIVGSHPSEPTSVLHPPLLPPKEPE
jgi:hypothetical protein